MSQTAQSAGWLAWLAVPLFWLASFTPRLLLRAWAWFLGALWFFLIRVRRRECLAHLEATGVATGREALRITRQVMTNQVHNVLEMVAWKRLARARGRVPWIRVIGADHLAEAGSARGTIILSGHVGNFDLLACHQGLIRGPIHIVSKRLSSPRLNALWMETRASCGVHALPVDAPIGPALDVLSGGGVVCLVLDQHAPEKRAIEAEFLGIPARTSPALATLALRSGAMVVPVFSRRESGGHVLEFEAPWKADPDGSVRERIDRTTRRGLALVEAAVRRDPGQWLWLHRRWKDSEGTPLVLPSRSVTTSSGDRVA